MLSGINVHPNELSRVASMVGCKEAKLPFVYLGVPIGASMKKESSWKTLLHKFRRKLSSWKARHISYGGKLTLCKTVLGSLGTYLFSLYKVPSTVLKKLERIRKKFFWGATEDKVKISWVAWDQILNSKDKGGLGIGSLKAQNVALLTKWWWRFRLEKVSLWKRVIMALYGDQGNLGCCNEAHKRYGTWDNIASISLEADKVNLPLNSLFSKSLGNGSDTKFWMEPWCDNIPLEVRFPRLAALDLERQRSVADRLSNFERGTEFVWRWRRVLREGRETRQLLEMQKLCEKVVLKEGEGC